VKLAESRKGGQGGTRLPEHQKGKSNRKKKGKSKKHHRDHKGWADMARKWDSRNKSRRGFYRGGGRNIKNIETTKLTEKRAKQGTPVTRSMRNTRGGAQERKRHRASYGEKSHEGSAKTTTVREKIWKRVVMGLS